MKKHVQSFNLKDMKLIVWFWSIFRHHIVGIVEAMS